MRVERSSMSENNGIHSPIRRIGFIGNHLPRQCGIATFTTDLCDAIANQYSETTCIALPVNDIAGGCAYPARVRFELTEKDIASYPQAADFLNINNVDLVCLQHEYGIYGGPAGSHILALLRELHMPSGWIGLRTASPHVLRMESAYHINSA